MDMRGSILLVPYAPRSIPLREGVELPSADVLGIFQSGAYGRTASPLGFLSHPTAPEVMVRDGYVRLVRRQGTVEDLLGDPCLRLC